MSPAVAFIQTVSLPLFSKARLSAYGSIGTDRNTDIPKNLYSGCDTDPTHNSMCCAWTETNSNYLNINSGTKCRSDGLCENLSGSVVWRTACTDPTWQAPECIQLCTNGTKQASMDVQITPCNDGSYCCGDPTKATSQACCDSGQGVFIKNGREVPKTASVASSSTVPTASTSSPPQVDKTKHSSDTGAIVGGVVGGVAGLLALVGVVSYLLYRRRRGAFAQPSNDLKWPSITPNQLMAEADATSTQKIEAPGMAVMRPELGETEPPLHEMATSP